MRNKRICWWVFVFLVRSRFVQVCGDAFCRFLADQRFIAILSTFHVLKYHVFYQFVSVTTQAFLQPLCRYPHACAHGSGIDQHGHFLHVWTNFVRHACCHYLFDMIIPLTIRGVCAQFCKIIHDMLSQNCNGLLLRVWRLYTLAMPPSTHWMDALCSF